MKQSLRSQKLPSQSLKEANKQGSHIGFVLKSNITEIIKEVPLSLASCNLMTNELFQATHRNTDKCSASVVEVCSQETIILIQLKELIFQNDSKLRTITGKGVTLQFIIAWLSEFIHGMRPKF